MELSLLYKTYRPLLFSIAYRLLGSVSDAEDLVQEAFLAWTERSSDDTKEDMKVHHEKAFLCKIITNRCTDLIRKQIRQRESYPGYWLPEPLIEDMGGPEDVCLNKETLGTAYLLLLQQLSAAERTVFVLREAFGYSYEEIAEMTGKSAANCRQLFRRARNAMPTAQSLEQLDVRQQQLQARDILTEFTRSFEQGDTARIIQLLTSQAVLISDGGGKVKAAMHPIRTPERIIPFIFGVVSKAPADLQMSVRMVNGLPGFVYSLDGVVQYVVSFAFERDRISQLFLVLNPDKLSHLSLKSVE